MSNKTVMKRMQDYIRDKELKRKQKAFKAKVKAKRSARKTRYHLSNEKAEKVSGGKRFQSKVKANILARSKATLKVVVKRKHVGATKVSHSEYDKQKNQWIRHYN